MLEPTTTPLETPDEPTANGTPPAEDAPAMLTNPDALPPPEPAPEAPLRLARLPAPKTAPVTLADGPYAGWHLELRTNPPMSALADLLSGIPVQTVRGAKAIIMGWEGLADAAGQPVELGADKRGVDQLPDEALGEVIRALGLVYQAPRAGQ